MTSALMQRHDAIFLEEPPSADFNDMLQGAVSIEDYLMPLDVEYPEFSRGMCCPLRNLYAQGKVIIQVEPFLEILLGIHDFFAEGHTPVDLPKDVIEYPVFLADFALKEIQESGRLYGPGDRLTLRFIFQPTVAETRQHRMTEQWHTGILE